MGGLIERLQTTKKAAQELTDQFSAVEQAITSAGGDEKPLAQVDVAALRKLALKLQVTAWEYRNPGKSMRINPVKDELDVVDGRETNVVPSEPIVTGAKVTQAKPVEKADDATSKGQQSADYKRLNAAKKYNLNLNSPTSAQVIDNLDIICAEFIAKYRRGNLKAEFPGEYLQMTVRKALDADKSKVRKLLTDGRFAK
jgi:hypothetical protein